MDPAKPVPAAKKADASPATKLKRSARPKRVPKAAAEARAAKPRRSERRKPRAVPRKWPLVLAGSATALLAVGMVAAGTLVPGSNATAQLALQNQVLPVGDSLSNCVGPTQLVEGAAAGTDPQFAPGSSSTKSQLSAVVLSNPDGTLPGAGVESLDAKGTPLFTLSKAPAQPAAAASTAPATLAPITGAAKGKAALLQNQDVSAASVLRAVPLAGLGPLSAGAVVVDSADGDLKGLSAATCQPASNDFWLAGASTTVGRTAVLKLANSSKSPATVSLDLVGAGGPVQAPGGKGLVVAPGASRSVMLSGLAPDQELLSVHVKSSGGPVSAFIQQSVLRGLTPGGVDFLQPVQAPGTSQAIPGVRVQAPAAAAKIAAQSGYSDASTALMVTVPGAADAIVEVKAYGPTGQVPLPGGGVFTATAGKVSQLSLAGLAEGTYTLTVSSNASVVAGVRLVNSTKPGAATDIAFAPTAARLGNNQLLSLPAGLSTTLVLAAPTGTGSVDLVPISASGALGAQKTVTLQSGQTTMVDPTALLGSGTVAVLVSASGEAVYGTQLLGAKGSANIAVLPIAATSAEAQQLGITTRF